MQVNSEYIPVTKKSSRFWWILYALISISIIGTLTTFALAGFNKEVAQEFKQTFGKDLPLSASNRTEVKPDVLSALAPFEEDVALDRAVANALEFEMIYAEALPDQDIRQARILEVSELTRFNIEQTADDMRALDDIRGVAVRAGVISPFN